MIKNSIILDNEEDVYQFYIEFGLTEVQNIYFLYGNNHLIYVGRTWDLGKRISAHYRDKKILFNKVKYIRFNNKKEENISHKFFNDLEKSLIFILKPDNNIH